MKNKLDRDPMKHVISGPVSFLIFVTFLVSTSTAQMFVDFSGGGGDQLHAKLPALNWEITDSSAFNSLDNFGVVIAVNQSPLLEQTSGSIPGNPSEWSSSNNSITFEAQINGSFFHNNDFAEIAAGGIVWWGMAFSQNSTDGDIIYYEGGTISSNAGVPTEFEDGYYNIYLVNGQTGSIDTLASVPEPESWGIASGLLMVGIVIVCRKQAHRASATRTSRDTASI